MSRKRKAIPLKVQLAAALCQLGEIDVEHAKQMTPEMVRSLFDLNHVFPHALGGSDGHWNLEFQFKPAHKKRTREIDVPLVAKSKRISNDWQNHKQMLAHKAGRAEKPERKPSRVQSRPLPKKPEGASYNWRRGGRLEMQRSDP